MLNTPQAATWVTRKGVYVDRIASAWLIQRFIDEKARFKFVHTDGYVPEEGELRYDMFEGEFTHEGERCTFETLLERFKPDDPALRAVAEIVHDIDFKDDKFDRDEAPGVASVLHGITLANAEDTGASDDAPQATLISWNVCHPREIKGWKHLTSGFHR